MWGELVLDSYRDVQANLKRDLTSRQDSLDALRDKSCEGNCPVIQAVYREARAYHYVTSELQKLINKAVEEGAAQRMTSSMFRFEVEQRSLAIKKVIKEWVENPEQVLDSFVERYAGALERVDKE